MAGQAVSKEICDVDAEKILLATILKQGESAFYEADAKVKDYDFYLPANKITYMAIGKVLAPGSNQKLDLANVLAKVKEIDPRAVQLYSLTDYLLNLSNYKINSTDISTIAGRIAKISIVRNLQDKLVNISESLSEVDFNKSLSEILVNVEKPLFEFSNELVHANDTIDLGSFADGYLEYLITNKPEYQGISTGFPIYDELIGGGLRRPGVHLIAGRAKCINPKNSYVITNQGILTPNELHENKDQDFTIGVINKDGKTVKTSKWFNNGKQKTIKITTERKYNIEVSEDHQLIIIDEYGQFIWKKAKDISHKDNLVLRKGDNLWGSKELCPDYAYICGLLCGDGHIGRKGCLVSLTNKDEIIVNKYTKFAKKNNYRVSKATKLNNLASSYNLVDNPDLTKQIFKRDDFYNSRSRKIIPRFVRESTKESICLFLKGLFDTDGTVESRSVSITTKSRELKQQLQYILLNLGIISTIKLKTVFINNKKLRYYTLSIQGNNNLILFHDLINFELDYKRNKLEILCNKTPSGKGNVLPKLPKLYKKMRPSMVFGRKNANDRDVYNDYISEDRKPSKIKISHIIARYSNNIEYKNHIDELCKDCYLYESIRSIKHGMATVGDYHVPDGNSFVANGFINHNCGKSFIGSNSAYHNASNGIKVLYADTELTQEIVSTRTLARASGVPINDIENGSFAGNPLDLKKVRDAINVLKENKIHYHNISGKDHREWISIFRKWILKEVGFDANGNTNPCLIVLDYIKVMNLDHMKGYAEFQYLGQIITDLHNFCIKYNIAILAFAQLNREGITKEDQGVIAGSDRLIGLCSSCAMIKKKTADDYADDPKANGDRKLIILASRFGPGTEDGEYINLKTDLARGLIEEGRTNLQNRCDRNDGGNFAGAKGDNGSGEDESIEF